jgi:hypothetical protein
MMVFFLVWFATAKAPRIMTAACGKIDGQMNGSGSLDRGSHLAVQKKSAVKAQIELLTRQE